MHEESEGFKEVDDGVDPVESMCSCVAWILAIACCPEFHCQGLLDSRYSYLSLTFIKLLNSEWQCWIKLRRKLVHCCPEFHCTDRPNHTENHHTSLGEGERRLGWVGRGWRERGQELSCGGCLCVWEWESEIAHACVGIKKIVFCFNIKLIYVACVLHHFGQNWIELKV